MVRNLLNELKISHPHIEYAVVLAYLPCKKDDYQDYSDTIYPDGLEKVPRRFAICKRNEWMINRSDIVITYVTDSFGGAYTFKQLAEKKGKVIINIAESDKAI